MSKTIDERVVSMQFDNKHFEKNAQTSMSTLDKLKQKLNLSGASKGLDEVNSAAKKVDMSSLGKGVDSVIAKFSYLDVVGVTALSNLVNSAVNAGKRIVSALTIDPVKTGFDEYETKINAIQTIMSNTSSKGTTMSDVTKVLDELNTYADKTIYNFAEMTRNIGTFTAAGIGLEDSAASIKGIANLAAASGSTSQQASTAMYQLSQALAAGTVKLMDWNSVVNAGMGGEKFQEALKATARDHGIAVDKIIEKNGSFRESLQEGWISADILNETLRKFTVEGATEYAKSMMESGKWTQAQADALIKEAQSMEDAATKVKTFTQLMDTMKESAQSGWAQTWELIFGNFEEAKDFFSSVSDLIGEYIGESADSRNSIIGGALNSKWDTFIAKVNEAGVSTEEFNEKLKITAKDHGVAIDDLIEEHGSLATVISKGLIPTEAFTDALGKLDVEGEDAAKSLKEANTYLVKQGDNLTKIATKYGMTWKELYTLNRDIIKDPDLIFTGQILKLSDAQLKSIGYTEKQINVLKDLEKQAKETGTPINELIERMGKPSGRQLMFDSLRNAIEGFLKVLRTIRGAWGDIFPSEKTSEGLFNIIESIHNFSEKLIMTDETAENLRKTLKGLFAILDIIRTVVGGGLRFAFKVLSKVLGLADIDVLSITASVGDAIVKFRDWLFENNLLVKGIEKLVGWIRKGISAIKEWWNNFKQLPVVQKNVANFKKAFTDAFDKVKDRLDKTSERFKEFTERVKKLEGGFTFENVKKVIKDFWENVVKYLFNFDGLFSSISSAFNKLKNDISNNLNQAGTGFSEFKQKVSDVINWIKDKFSNINWGNVFAIGISAGTIVLMNKISNIFKVFAEGFKGFGDLAKNIADVFLGVQKALNAFAMKTKAEALKSIAMAILILVGSIAVLVMLIKDDSYAVWTAVGVLGILAGALAGFIVALTFLGKQGDKLKDLSFSAMFLSIGAALLIFVACMKMIAGMSTGDIAKGILIVGLFGAFVIALLNASKLVTAKTGTQMIGLAKFLKEVGVALILMAITLKIIGTMSSDDIAKGLFVITIFGGIITGLIAASKLSSASSLKDIANLGILMKQFGVAMLLFAATMKIIGTMSGEDIAKGIIVLSAFGGLITGLVAVTKLIGKTNGAQMLGMGKMLKNVGIGLILMSASLKIIATMSVGDLLKGVIVIGVLSLIMSGLVAISKYSGEHASKAGSMIMKMGAAFLLIAASMAIISLIKPEDLEKAIIAIGAVSACFAGLIYVSKHAKDAKATIISLAIAIGVISIALAALSMIDSSSLATASASLSGVIAVFALLIYVTKLINTGFKNVMATIGILIAMAGIVYVLGYVIKEIAKCDPENALGSAAALSVLLLALSAALLIISKSFKASDILDAVVGIAAFALLAVALQILVWDLRSMEGIKDAEKNAIILGGLAAVLTALLVVLTVVGFIMTATCGLAALGLVAFAALAVELQLVIWALRNMESLKDAEKNANVLINMMRTIGDLIINISAVGPMALGAVAAVGGMEALMVALGALAVAIGALMEKFPQLEEFLDKGIEVLKKLANGIGSIIGELVKGFMTTVASGLPEIGSYLSQFMLNALPFITLAKQVDQKVLDGVGILVKSLIALVAADFLENIVSFMSHGDSFASLGSQLSQFMLSAVPFINLSKQVDAKSLEGVKALSEVIVALTQANLIDSLNFFSDPALITFGEQLVPFGQALVDFSNVVKGNVDNDAVQSAANAAKLMSSLAKDLPKQPGAIASLFSDSTMDMDTFGSKLVPFGKAMVAFSDSVKGKIDQEAVESAASAGKIMASLAKDLPEQPGAIASLFGSHSINLDEFGAQLELFGSAMVTFSNSVKGKVDVKAAEAAASAGQIMASLAEDLPEDPGAISGLFGENAINLDDFGADLEAFGKAMVTFSKTVKGKIDIDAVQAAASAGQIMNTLANELPEESGWLASWFSTENKMNMETFGNQLKAFGEAIIEFSGTVSEGNIDHESIDNVLTTTKQLVNIAKSLPEEIDFSILKKGIESLSEIMKDFSEDISGEVDTSAITSVTTACKNLAEAADAMPDIVDFSLLTNGLSEFGKAIVDFSKSVGDGNVNLVSVALAVTAGKMIVGMIEGMNASFDKQSIIDYVGTFYTVATAIKNFSTVAGEIDTTNVETVTTACKQIDEAIDLMLDTDASAQSIFDYISTFYSVANAIKSFADTASDTNTDNVDKTVDAGTKITDLINSFVDKDDQSIFDYISTFYSVANAIKSFADTASDTDSSKVESVSTAGKKISEMIKAFPNSTESTDIISNLPAIGKSMATFSSEIKDITTSDLNNIVDGFKTMVEKFKIIGGEFVSKFVEGVKGAKSKISSAFTEVFTGSVNSIDKTALYNKIYEVGKEVVNGFATGISSNSYKAKIAAIAMANAVYEKVRSILDVNSPSKVFKWLGSSIPEGFILGIESMSNAVKKSASNIGDDAIEGTRNAISDIAKAINSDIDAQPTIRPILDLSEISSGAGAISRMLDVNPSVGVLSNIRSINSMMNRNQNGANDDVISAIKDLGRKIGNISGNTYNVNGVTYDDGSNITDAVKTIVRAAKIERRT